MLDAKSKQFSLNAAGEVLYQPDASNPLPGEPVAQLKKGQQALAPELISQGNDSGVKEKLESWLASHIREVLEPLVFLQNTDDLPAPVKGICFQVYESMGITPREGLEDLIKDLDPEMRQHLRDRKVRLGPILAFVPALNKPAAVKLRGILWALWNNKNLPVDLPKDGVVSFQIDPKNVDHDFYQSIGYPVFGPRAIRIDMLDRVISAVYDGARHGKFQAQHKMAEWLGSSIEDLYAVLESMGHKRIKTSDDLKVSKDAKTSEASEASKTSEDSKFPETTEEKTPQDEKPDLAMFYLKKGKAFESRKPPVKNPRKDQNPAAQKPKKDKKNNRKDKGPRIVETGPKKRLEDSPFAILQQLKD